MDDKYINGSKWANVNVAHFGSTSMSIHERSQNCERGVLTSEVVDNCLSADLGVRTLCSTNDTSDIFQALICAHYLSFSLTDFVYHLFRTF